MSINILINTPSVPFTCEIHLNKTNSYNKENDLNENHTGPGAKVERIEEEENKIFYVDSSNPEKGWISVTCKPLVKECKDNVDVQTEHTKTNDYEEGKKEEYDSTSTSLQNGNKKKLQNDTEVLKIEEQRTIEEMQSENKKSESLSLIKEIEGVKSGIEKESTIDEEIRKNITVRPTVEKRFKATTTKKKALSFIFFLIATILLCLKHHNMNRLTPQEVNNGMMSTTLNKIIYKIGTDITKPVVKEGNNYHYYDWHQFKRTNVGMKHEEEEEEEEKMKFGLSYYYYSLL